MLLLLLLLLLLRRRRSLRQLLLRFESALGLGVQLVRGDVGRRWAVIPVRRLLRLLLKVVGWRAERRRWGHLSVPLSPAFERVGAKAWLGTHPRGRAWMKRVGRKPRLRPPRWVAVTVGFAFLVLEKRLELAEEPRPRFSRLLLLLLLLLLVLVLLGGMAWRTLAVCIHVSHRRWGHAHLRPRPPSHRRRKPLLLRKRMASTQRRPSLSFTPL